MAGVPVFIFATVLLPPSSLPIASSQLVVPVGRTEVVLYDVRVDRQTQRSTGVHGELEVQAGQHACEHDVLAQNGPLHRVGFEE